jgi:mannose-6-phosphate isomerase-like protein (cupin superfamily)
VLGQWDTEPVRIIDFGPTTGLPVDRYESQKAAFSRVVETSGTGHVACMHLGADGILGRHPAASAQLFCVVAGEGEVSGADGVAVTIRAGEAALWEAGETHETTTRTGLTALIYEVEAIHPQASQSRR